MSRRTISVLIGVVISLAALYIAGRGVNFADVSAAIKSANYWWLIPNVVVILGTMYLRAWRWGAMVAPIKKVAFKKLLSATAVGFMANNLLPFRIGEFVRAYSLSSQDKDVSKSASLAMIFTERIIFDLAALIGIFGIVLFFTKLNIPPEVKDGSVIIVLIAFSGLIFSLVMARWPQAISNFVHDKLTFLPAKLRGFLRTAIERFALGLAFMRNPAAGLVVMAQTLVIWVALGISNYFVFLAFNLDAPLEASFATLSVVSIAITLPSTPGFIGVYHAAVVYVLKQYGVPTDIGFGCAVIMHAAQFVAVTLYGLYYLWKSHLTLRDVERVAAGDVVR